MNKMATDINGIRNNVNEQVQQTPRKLQIPKDNLGEAFEKNIRPYIEVIDDLRKHGLQNDIKLPNVVVVGDQSSGKSSIIESLSGVQLPRGRGIVTRCPLELQLKRMLNNVKWKGVLSFNGVECVVPTPEDVGNLICRSQDEICGIGKNISDKLLTLRIESNSKAAAELTLIDLPGIARTAVEGQSSDICHRIKKIIETHIKNENTVILCVISANLDVAVNESLNLAKLFDPEFERTIGVITKPDLAENHQKEAMISLLNNKTFKLKKGYRIVKCRSQKEIEGNVLLEKMLIAEEEFFKNDPFYRSVDPLLIGTKNLADKITEELVTVIKKTIPKLKDQVKSELDQTRKHLDCLPTSVPEGEADKRAYLTMIIFEMLRNVERLLTKGSHSTEKNNEKNIYPSLRKKFESFQNELVRMQEDVMMNEFSIDKLKKKIEYARGREIGGFLNYELFEDLASSHVQKYHPVAKDLLHNMKIMTEDALRDVIDNSLGHLPPIKADIMTLVSNSMDSFNGKAEENLSLIFEEEIIVFAMDNMFHEEFSRLFQQPQSTFLIRPTGIQQNIPNMEDNATMLWRILTSYLKIVLNRLCDTVPMTIRQWIHIRLNNTLKHILTQYASGGGHEDKVQENIAIQHKRKSLVEKLKRLNIAKGKLSSF